MKKKSSDKEQLLHISSNAQFREKHPKAAALTDVATGILLAVAALMLLAYLVLGILEKIEVFRTYNSEDWEGFAALVAILLTIAFILSFFFKKEKQGKADFAHFSKLITLSSGIMAVLFWVYVIFDTLL